MLRDMTQSPVLKLLTSSGGRISRQLTRWKVSNDFISAVQTKQQEVEGKRNAHQELGEWVLDT
jgi:hypothetical protein